MASVRFTIFVVFLLKNSTSYAFHLSPSAENATAGVEFSFICTTDETSINFIKDKTAYCSIDAADEDNCMLDSGCITNQISSCSRMTNKLKITLTASSVTDELDGSIWVCETLFGGGIPSNEVTLHVNIPIKSVNIRATPTDVNPIRIVTGKPQKFICTTDAGRPSSSIRWYISDTDVTEGVTVQPDVCNQNCNDKVVSSSVLLYTGNRNDDGQNIHCTAQNIEGRNVRSQNRTIAILYGPNGVTMNPSTQTYLVRETSGSVGPIQCIADDCYPKCTIIWNGPNIPDRTSSILNIQNISRTQAGKYSCTASNLAWNRTSLTVNIIVEYGPKEVVLFPLNHNYMVKETGSVVPINCTAACKPDCSITWSGPNLPDSSSSVLNLINITRNQSGNYKCNATNIVGSLISETLVVIVHYGPNEVLLNPSTQNYAVTENVGSVGPITCAADDCKPNCTMTWSGPKMYDSTSSVLNLQNIVRNNAGSYICTASNSAWSKTSVSVNVIVEYGPSEVNIFPSSQTYNVTETGMVGPISCTADCTPNCTMTWSGPNLPDPTATVLHLENIGRNQAGNYRCTAANSIGEKTSVIVIVIVNYGPRQVKIFPSTLNYVVIELSGHVGPINCTADCKPDCTMTWTGPVLPVGTKSVLNLQTIDRNNSGNYMCTATNKIGSPKTVTVGVIVNYGPREVNVLPTTNTYTVIEKSGSVGPITCTADCKPDCTFTWNGPSLPYGISSVLNLQEIRRNQTGQYVCFASNSIGNRTSTIVSVIVHYGPDNVIISPYKKYYTVNETGNVENISCASDCMPNCTMQWSGPNLPSYTKSVLNLQNIERNQTGNYRCTASNNVGNKTSFSIQITVNFRPVVFSLYGNRTFHENDTVTFSCNVESVPTSTIQWMFEDKQIENSVLVSINSSNQASVLNILSVGCLSMGTYMCAAMNLIGKNYKESAIDVTCSPRINDNEYKVAPSITVKDQQPLNITAPIIAYPKPNIYWTFVKNESVVNVTQKTSSIAIKNRVFSNLYIENVTETDFGSYRVYAFNNIGNHQHYIYAFEVTPERKPNPPENLTCIGSSNSILIHWKSTFNGGDTQTFHIYIQKDGDANFFDYGPSYTDPGQNEYSEAIIGKLIHGTIYNLKVRATNKHNFSMSELTTCNTTAAVGDNQANRDSLAIGAGTGISAAIIVIVIVTVVIILIRRRKIDQKLGQDKELIKRSANETEEDGLKENPLYVSSTPEDVGAVYSIVNKNGKFLNQEKSELTDDSSVYTQVIKTQKKDGKKAPAARHKKSSNKDIKEREIEMGCVYENPSDINHGMADDVYANSEVKRKVLDKNVFKPTMNKDGLIYADLDLTPTANGKRFVIRGLENRNNYAVIDLTKTAEPLPSDSDNEEDQSHKNTEEK